MFSIRRQIKKLSATLALILFLAGAFLSSHHHSTAKNEKETNCSICQISHSNTKSLSPTSSFHFVDLKPLFNLWVSHLPVLVSKNHHSSQIRGPPALA